MTTDAYTASRGFLSSRGEKNLCRDPTPFSVEHVLSLPPNSWRLARVN